MYYKTRIAQEVRGYPVVTLVRGFCDKGEQLMLEVHADMIIIRKQTDIKVVSDGQVR